MQIMQLAGPIERWMDDRRRWRLHRKVADGFASAPIALVVIVCRRRLLSLVEPTTPLSLSISWLARYGWSCTAGSSLDSEANLDSQTQAQRPTTTATIISDSDKYESPPLLPQWTLDCGPDNEWPMNARRVRRR